MQRVLLLAVVVRVCALKHLALRGSLEPSRRDAVQVGGGGNPDCPCIGIENVSGKAELMIEHSLVIYPAEVGSYCAAWDDGRNQEFCLEGQNPGKGNGFCSQKWCWVDACNCKGVGNPPKASRNAIAFQGRPVYYSYDTCGNKDVWTEEHNLDSCVNAHTEKDCMRQNDGNCIWGKTPFGSEPRCVGWEASGLCPGLPKVSHWGKRECPCVGMIGLEGVKTVPRGNLSDFNYSASVGSICKPWDAFIHPECMGEDVPEWCHGEWCFVDSRECEVEGHFVPHWLDGAQFHHHQLHVSYETCGHKAPNRTTTTSVASTTQPSSTTTTLPSKQEDEPPNSTTTTLPSKQEDEPPSSTTTTVPSEQEDEPTSSTTATLPSEQEDEPAKEDEVDADKVDQAVSTSDPDDDVVDDSSSDREPEREVHEDLESSELEHRRPSRESSRYDEDAYDADWHNEWNHRQVPH